MKKHYKTINKYDLVLGQQFSRWTVCSEDLIQHSGRKQIQVKCACGNYGIVRHDRLKSGKSLGCKSCQKMSKYPETRISRAYHYKGLRKAFLSRIDWGITHRSSYKIIKNLVTIEQLYQKLVEQDFKCALTRIELNVIDLNPIDSNASIDRIDSEGDYEFDNIQWVLKEVNIMKNSFSQEFFIDMCRKIANKHDNPELSPTNDIEVVGKVQRLGGEESIQ